MICHIPGYFRTTKPEEIKSITISPNKKTLKIECEYKTFYTTIEHIVNLMELEQLYEEQQEKERSYASLQETN